jgi:hypothetical protein
MADLILTAHTNNESLFDSIRQTDEYGEFWSARELMPMLGYDKWQRAIDVIDRATAALKLNEHKVSDHITGGGKMIQAGKGATRRIEDFRLSRLGCYMVAMSGDARKPEIACAHQYFAIKTREAETIIPSQNDRIRELELINENLRLKNNWGARQDNRIALHGLPVALLLEGKDDAIVEVEKPTVEIIDKRCNVTYKGQSLAQIAKFLNKRYGLSLKSGADVKRLLNAMGQGGLIGQAPRTLLGDYVPEENLAEVYQLLQSGNQQTLLG